MKDKIITITTLIIIYGVMVISIITKDNTYSFSERRELAKLPTKFSDTYFEKLDNYLVDNIAFRENFRSLKSYYNFFILNELDNNNAFVKNGYIFKMDELNKKSITYFVNKINKLYDTYLSNNKVYLSIIPDKLYYLDDDTYLKKDYDYIFDTIPNNINKNITYIDIRDDLKLEDYYQTDIHLKQESYLNVLKTLAPYLDINHNTTYEKKIYDNFYGALYGNIALNIKPDTITTLNNSTIDKAIVYNYEKNITDKVYNEEYLKHLDAYDIFLGGATPLITITNNDSNNDKELIIFRDSFGSSLAPLLINNYHKITLVDIRYINSKLLKDYIDFNNKDILIIYGLEVINNSFSLN